MRQWIPRFDSKMLRAIVCGVATPCLAAVRYGLTLALFCGIWWYDARYLNRAFDVNLAAIKASTGIVDGSGKAEAMLRAFAAEKMLLFGEVSAVIWTIGRAARAGVRWLFGKAARDPTPRTARRPAITLPDRSGGR